MPQGMSGPKEGNPFFPSPIIIIFRYGPLRMLERTCHRIR